MMSYRRTLPPLDLVVFFEAAHRLGSFTACASELGVTQAAVSKRIRQLEDWVGDDLFIRTGKRIAPTTAGNRLAQTTGMALEFLAQGLNALRETAQRPLSIGCNTAFGMFWLSPQLRRFGLSPDGCPIRLVTSDNNRDLFEGGNDLVIAYGDGNFPGWISSLLLEELLTPLAAPRLIPRAVEKLNDIAAKPRPPLLNYPRSGPDWVDWRVWFKSLGLKGLEGWRLKTLSTYAQTIGEAIEGHGIALGSLTLLNDDLKAGTLIPLTRESLHTGRGYYLCHPETTGLPPNAQRLANVLLEAARNGREIPRTRTGRRS